MVRWFVLAGLVAVAACRAPAAETAPPEPEKERVTTRRGPTVRGPTEPPSATDIAETRTSAPACASFLGDPRSAPTAACADSLHEACTGGGPTDEIARVVWWLATSEKLALAERDARMWSAAQACAAQIADATRATALAAEQLGAWRAADDPVAVSRCLDRCVIAEDVRVEASAWEAGRGYAARIRAQVEAVAQAAAELVIIDDVAEVRARLAAVAEEIDARRDVLGEELAAAVTAEKSAVAEQLDARTAELARAHVATRLAEIERITKALRAVAGQGRGKRTADVEALVDSGEGAARSARRVLRKHGALLGPAGRAKLERALEKASREMDRAVTAARKAVAPAEARKAAQRTKVFQQKLAAFERRLQECERRANEVRGQRPEEKVVLDLIAMMDELMWEALDLEQAPEAAPAGIDVGELSAKVRARCSL